MLNILYELFSFSSFSTEKETEFITAGYFHKLFSLGSYTLRDFGVSQIKVDSYERNMGKYLVVNPKQRS